MDVVVACDTTNMPGSMRAVFRPVIIWLKGAPEEFVGNKTFDLSIEAVHSAEVELQPI